MMPRHPSRDSVAVASLLTRFVPLLTLVPVIAEAHTGIGETAGFHAGFTHPLGGLDHACAMAGVGLWAAQRGGRALWMLPAAFALAMGVGGALATSGVGFPAVERIVALSVLAVGVLVAASVRGRNVAAAAVVGTFALFHGHAHGTEMPATASGLAYGAGFVLATILLHVAGIGLVLALRRTAAPSLVRLCGSAIAVCGLRLLLS
jgi:urease accessory protein